MIEGVVIKKLTRHVDERGYVMEILRADEELFAKFGQAYLSACFAGVVKAWHRHRLQFDHFCCLAGTLKVGLYDDRPGSSTAGQTQTIIIGELVPALVRIPPLVWHGFMALNNQTAVVLNLPTEIYNYDEPDEQRRDPFDPEIPFVWEPKSG